jgi:hypothetical protein
MKPEFRVCADTACGRSFAPNSGKQRYCSDRCRYRARDRRDYAADREGELARSRRYYERHREKKLAKVKASRGLTAAIYMAAS